MLDFLLNKIKGKSEINAFNLTEAHIKNSYRKKPSIAPYLPWMDFDDKTETFVLQNGVDAASVLELEGFPCEGKPDSILHHLSDACQNIFGQAIPEMKDSPYIVQFYLCDQYSLSSYADAVKNYIPKEYRNRKIARFFIKHFADHCKYLCKKDGVFTDNLVTGIPFRGRIRRVRMVIYRHINKSVRLPKGQTAAETMNQITSNVVTLLKSSGIGVKRYQAAEFFEWMMRWFNPNPKKTDGDVDKLVELYGYPSKEEKPFGFDFVEQMFHSLPVVDKERGIFYFDDKPHRYLSIDNLARVPEVGQISAEKPENKEAASTKTKWNAFFDKFPSGSIFTMTVAIVHRNQAESLINQRRENAIGDKPNAVLAREEADTASFEMEKGNSLYPTAMGIYISGDDDNELFKNQGEVQQLLSKGLFKLINFDDELYPQNSYLRFLPMSYSYQYDEAYLQRSRFVYARQLAYLMPIYGRFRSDTHPMFTLLNRLGEPFSFDPLSKAWKSFNSHLIGFGTTGAGKSAFAVFLIITAIVFKNARIVIVESGNSFKQLMAILKELGVNVNDVEIQGSNNTVSLNILSEATKLINSPTIKSKLQDIETEISAFYESLDKEAGDQEKAGESRRDLMLEIVNALTLAATGGEEEEIKKFTRIHRYFLIEAVIETIREFIKNPPADRDEIIIDDVVQALYRLSDQKKQENMHADATKIDDLAKQISIFTSSSLAAELFNKPGKPWPDADVTRLELGPLGDEGNEAEMGLAIAGLSNKITSLCEATQTSGRPTIMIFDECHIVTSNVYTAVAVTRISKMSRKFNLWLWMFTQNLKKDFPAQARKILSMAEFMIGLGTTPEELEQVREYRNISDQDMNLFVSVAKEPGKFVDGVVLAPKITGIFRNVPPRIFLAMALSDPDEKMQREELIKQYNYTPLEAASHVARLLKGEEA